MSADEEKATGADSDGPAVFAGTVEPLAEIAGQTPAKLTAAFANRLFAALWIASFASNVGTQIQAVAAAWMVTVLTHSPQLVALVQTATTLPVLLLSIPFVLSGEIQHTLKTRGCINWFLPECCSLAVHTRGRGAAAHGIINITFPSRKRRL